MMHSSIQDTESRGPVAILKLGLQLRAQSGPSQHGLEVDPKDTRPAVDSVYYLPSNQLVVPPSRL